MKRHFAVRIFLLALFVLFPGATAVRAENPAYTAPDYANPDNWLTKPAELSHRADAIYIYPTTRAQGGALFCDIEDSGMRKGARETYQTQAAAFETCADIYAPFYRQADAVQVLSMPDEERQKTQRGVPALDVAAALDYYFENFNKGRPFFLVGHSQGAALITIVLDTWMKAHPEYYKNMVAAYMVGFAPTKEWLAANPHVKMAEGAEDTGVIISWNTEGPRNVGKHNAVVPQNAVCINPLNWKRDETPAGILENKGSLLLSSDMKTYTLVTPGIADAKIDLQRGSVICSTVSPDLYAIPAAKLFGPESYHLYDFAFYFANIRENAALRLSKFSASGF